MQGWKSEGTWKQRKKEDNGVNGQGNGKDGEDISPVRPWKPQVTRRQVQPGLSREALSLYLSGHLTATAQAPRQGLGVPRTGPDTHIVAGDTSERG